MSCYLQGANVNIGDKEEDTPLHLACSHRFIRASKLLVEAGERQSLIVLSALYTLGNLYISLYSPSPPSLHFSFSID